MKVHKVSNIWLRDKFFDLPFILLFSSIAIITGYVVSQHPALFPTIMIINLWLLGYHHVISTYTRIAFSAQSIKEFRFLVFQLPIIVLVGVTILLYFGGEWAVATTYLYWQWFHYTRQSYGISRYYMAKSGQVTKPWHDVNTYALYLLPLTGILYRSYQAPEKFLYLDVATLPVTYEVVMFFLGLSILAILLQIFTWIKQYKNQTLSYAYVLYVLSHHTVFGIAYLLIENINHGWLVLNIWHNAQYIGFVWMYNNNKFKTGINPQQKFISTISQNGKFLTYISICLAVTFSFYAILKLTQITIQPHTILPMAVLIYMSINFHHYVVDSIIWKRRKAQSGSV